MFWSFGLMFFLSNSGQGVTDRFDGICNQIYQCNWYLFPIKVKQMLPTMMIATQKPAILCGIGNILCSRDAFKKVICTVVFKGIQRIFSTTYQILYHENYECATVVNIAGCQWRILILYGVSKCWTLMEPLSKLFINMSIYHGN